VLIWRLRVEEGMQHQDIADKLGVDRSTVSKALKRIRERAMTSLNELAQQEIFEQLERLDLVIREALSAWKASRKEAKAVTNQLINPYPDDEEEHRFPAEKHAITTHVEERIGDHTYLDVMMRAMAEKRKILGLDAPTRSELSITNERNRSSGGPAAMGIPLDLLSTEDVEDLLALLEQLERFTEAIPGTATALGEG
jgi:transcriptional regulator with XRE-family HTH domain